MVAKVSRIIECHGWGCGDRWNLNFKLTGLLQLKS